MAQGKDKKFKEKVRRSFPDENSAFLASRGVPDKASVSFPKEASAFLSPRGEAEKRPADFKDSRYK